MSVPHETPLGVKLLCLLSAADALLNVGKAADLILHGDPMLPWPVAVGLGVGIFGQALWQLTTVYGLYMLKPSAYRNVLRALESGILVDFVGIFLGFSSPLDLVITVVGLVYLYSRRDLFLPAGRGR